MERARDCQKSLSCDDSVRTSFMCRCRRPFVGVLSMHKCVRSIFQRSITSHSGVVGISPEGWTTPLNSQLLAFGYEIIKLFHCQWCIRFILSKHKNQTKKFPESYAVGTLNGTSEFVISWKKKKKMLLTHPAIKGL